MTLRFGSTGNTVKQVQELLGIKADGIFGKQTESAVKQYQLAHGLVADGLVGSKTLASMGITVETGDMVIPCEDLKQFASPHGNMIYGKDKSYSTYAKGGCGVTSFAVVYRAYGLAPDGEKATETIQRLGKYATDKGYRVKGNGTSAGLFGTNGCKKRTITAGAVEDCIRSGSLVILNIKNGFGNGYTGTGHYIVAYGIKDDYLLLRDVGSSKVSRQKVKLSAIKTGLKNAWEVSKS